MTDTFDIFSHEEKVRSLGSVVENHYYEKLGWLVRVGEKGRKIHTVLVPAREGTGFSCEDWCDSEFSVLDNANKLIFPPLDASFKDNALYENRIRLLQSDPEEYFRIFPRNNT